MKWINCANTFPPDWESKIIRIVGDTGPIDTGLFEERDGALCKIGGTGRVEFRELEWLDESIRAYEVKIAKETAEEEWESFWKEIVCDADGTINIDQLKKELADFSFVIQEVPKVYCHITDGTLSKVLYHAHVVNSLADECYEKQFEEMLSGRLEEIKRGNLPLQLKIANPLAPTFNEAVGISDERRKELGRKMDAMVKSFGNSAVRSCDVFNEIAGYCNNIEELVYSVIDHCNWHAKRGNLLEQVK